MIYPPITALMVTNGDLNLVKRSYGCFKTQNYPNKYLLIVTDCEDSKHKALQNFVHETSKNVTLLHYNAKLSLGGLRNLSLEHAHSDLTMQLDDDDLCSPDRMMIQFNFLKDKKAVMLTEQLHYFEDTGEVALVKCGNGIEGTVLLDRRCGLRYPEQSRGEDTVLKNELLKKNWLNLAPGGLSYCRTYHGNNTWDREHHINRCKKMGCAISKQDLEKAAKIYGWKKWVAINPPI